jgi:isoleucyl-tRNA synthetase
VTYANIDEVQPESIPAHPENPLDRWVLSEAEKMVEEVTAQLDLYDLQKAIDPLVEFIDSLNNWYIRRSRRRFWRSENDLDKQQAYQTLWTVLIRLVQAAAPFIPFITEEIYLNLKTKDMPESVHLCDFPAPRAGIRDEELERKMKLTRQAVSMGRALRANYNLKIRQPLKAFHLVTKDKDEQKVLIEMEDIIKEELNVKSVVFRENEEELVEYSAKANYRVLGKELGKNMKAAAERIEKLSVREIQSLLEGATLSIDLDDCGFDLTQSGVVIERIEKEDLRVLNEGSLTVALDPELNETLIQEGLIRDLVRGIQNLRKEKDLEVTDRIELILHGSDQLKIAVEEFQEHLTTETLTVTWRWDKHPSADSVDCGEETAEVYLQKTAVP